MTTRNAARADLVAALRNTTIRVLPDRTLDMVADALLERGYWRSVEAECIAEKEAGVGSYLETGQVADDEFTSGEKIPRELRGPIKAARKAWREYWPGMELEGTADMIVLALRRAGWLRQQPRRGA